MATDRLTIETDLGLVDIAARQRGDGAWVQEVSDPAAHVRADLLGTRSFGAYHALAGRRYSAATDYVSGIPASGEQSLAAFRNPTDSGVVCFLDVGEFGADRNTRFRRYGGVAVTVDQAVSGPPSRNTGGQTRPAAARLYVPAQFTAGSAAAWSVRKTAHILAYQQYVTQPFGSGVVMPGGTLFWTLVGPESGGTGTVAASVILEWVELPLAAVNAAQAQLLADEEQT